MKEEILNLAAKLLPDGVDREKLALCGADVEEYICAYCSSSGIPEGCEMLAARMTAAAADGSIGQGALQSVTRGDFHASYQAEGRSGLEDFDRRLNRFRKLRWCGR